MLDVYKYALVENLLQAFFEIFLIIFDICDFLLVFHIVNTKNILHLGRYYRQPEQLTFWIAASIPEGMRRGRTLVLHL